MTMERGLSFGSRGPQSDFARLCWRVRIQNNNHQRHATTQGVSHAAVKHPARFRGLRAPHALYCAHQPNSAVKPTPTSSACGCPPCFALRRGLPRALVPSYSALCRPAFIPGFRLSQRFLLWGFGALPGFACIRCASFKPFWPLALVQKALPAIVLAALRRFRGPALFRGPRPSSRLGAPFWPSGLTLRSSGPAFCGPLTLAVERLLTRLTVGRSWPGAETQSWGVNLIYTLK